MAETIKNMSTLDEAATRIEFLEAENAHLLQVLDTIFEDMQSRTKAGMSWGINGHPTLSHSSAHLIQQTRFRARRSRKGDNADG